MSQTDNGRRLSATGQIELIKIGVTNGIVSTAVYYAASFNGEVPPGLETVEFEINGDGLKFEDVGASFHIHNDYTLWGWYDANNNNLQEENELYNFIVNDEVIKGILSPYGDDSNTSGWTRTIPVMEPGQYLWTKTIQEYNDGSKTISYGLYRWGADANTFKITTRFNEIVRFVTNDSTYKSGIILSPKKLGIRIAKQNTTGEFFAELNKEQLSISIISLNEDGAEQIGLDYFTLISNNQEIEVDLQKYLDDLYKNNLSSFLVDKNCYIEIKYVLNTSGTNTIELEEYLGVRYGTNYDMATFDLGLTGWLSASGGTELTFDEDGLRLKNGRFKILNKNNEEVLRADDYGNLELTGKIIAEAGEIGGFRIEKNYLVSMSDDGKPLISLSGKDGIITIGDNSTSGADYIAIDGPNCTIYGDSVPEAGSSDVTRHWSITPTEAIFNNIVAKGSLKASVFEYGKIQAIGGILVARPSSRIIDVIEHKDKDGNIFTKVKLEEKEYFDLGDECRIGGSFGGTGVGLAAITCFVCKVLGEEEDGDVWLGSSNVDLSEYSFENAKDAEESQSQITKKSIGEVILNLGKKGDIGIGINGSNNNSFIEKNAVSVFSKTDTGINTHIVLGKFSEDKKIYGALAGQYGLYADNVFLHGALVTKNQSDKTYSGINTIYSSDSPMSEGNSPIVFWAGAEGDTTEKIKNSPFLVDSDGRVYAQEAHITGSVIVGSLLDSPQIRTATIVGDGKTGYALTIEDLGNGGGLAFVTREGDENNQRGLFNLNTYKIYSMLPYQGTEIYVGNGNSSNHCLKITEEGFVHGNGRGLDEYETPDVANNQTISFNNADPASGVLEEIVFSIGGSPTLRTQEAWTFIHNDLKVEGDLWCDDKLKYQRTNNGYDLYVYD